MLPILHFFKIVYLISYAFKYRKKTLQISYIRILIMETGIDIKMYVIDHHIALEQGRRIKSAKETEWFVENSILLISVL